MGWNLKIHGFEIKASMYKLLCLLNLRDTQQIAPIPILFLCFFRSCTSHITDGGTTFEVGGGGAKLWPVFIFSYTVHNVYPGSTRSVA